MKTSVLLCALLGALLCASSAHAKEITIQGLPSVVVRTVPESGAVNVDPGLEEIRVTFSKDMLDKAWSCVNLSKDSYPAPKGEPKYDQDRRTFILPVKLEPGKTYAIMFNSEKYKNFMDTQHQLAMSYLLVFQTKK